jgi:hypothetical protein
VEAGPAPAMAALGATVPQRQDAFQALAAQPRTQAKMVCHTALPNRTAFGLVQACLEAEVYPGLIANVFLLITGSEPRPSMPMCRRRSSRRWSAIGRRWWNGWPPSWTR